MIDKKDLIKVIREWLQPVLDEYIMKGHNIMFIQSEEEFKWVIPKLVEFSTDTILCVKYDINESSYDSIEIYVSNSGYWCIYINDAGVEYNNAAISSFPGIEGIDAFDLYNKIKEFDKRDTKTYVFNHNAFNVGQPYCLYFNNQGPLWYLIKDMKIYSDVIISIDLTDSDGQLVTIYPYDIVSGKVSIYADCYESYELNLPSQIKSFVKELPSNG